MYKKIAITSLPVIVLCVIAFISLSNKEQKAPLATTIATETVVGDYDPIIVLELFTSQGCSSCPPADKLLDKVKSEYPNKVFALSYHVDYWNYIGWEDPFSDAVYTRKQGLYNQKFRSRSNYTPQLVVNGKEHFVGSNGSKLASKISQYGKIQSSNTISLSNVKQNGRALNFNYAIKGDVADRELRAVLVLDERITSVKRGENRNRVLKNSNIVVAEKYFNLESNTGQGRISIPAIVSSNDSLTLLLLTENEVADITGAVKKAI